MKIEVLCERDPDGPCTHRVFVDGVELAEGRNTDPALRVARHIVKLDVESIDPGAGYSWEDWAETTKAVQDNMNLTGRFRKAVVQARDDAAENSKYIDEPLCTGNVEDGLLQHDGDTCPLHETKGE